MKKLKRWQFILLIILYPIGMVYFCVWLYHRNQKAGKIVSITLGALVGGTMLLGGISGALKKNEPPSVVVDETTPAIIETTVNTTLKETTATAEKTTTTTTAAETTPITTTTKPETEVTTPAPETSTTTKATTVTEATTAQATATQTVAPTSTAERENHFTDHYNPEQQNTTEYVLNTSTMKVHKPGCRAIPTISEEHYATTNDLADAKSKGYKACGICHPF